MPRLIDLPGVNGGCIEDVQWFQTINDCLCLLRTYRAVMTASDHGAIHVYVDDAGKYRAILSRYRVAESEICVSTKMEVRNWLVQYLPTI